MKRLIHIVTILSALAAMSSCSTEERPPMRHDNPDRQLVQHIRSGLPETIRVFDPDEFFPLDTKSGYGMPVDISSDALDYDRATTLSTPTADYVQIPIDVVTPLSRATVRLPEFPEGRKNSEVAQAKSFLVTQFPKDSAEKTRTGIVTIVPHPDYMTREQLDSLDFFYSGFFHAVFIYSALDGEVRKTEVYIQGMRHRYCRIAVPLDGDTVAAVLTPETRGGDEGGSDGDLRASLSCEELPEVVCVGYTGDWMDWDNEDDDHPSNSHHNLENDKDDSPEWPGGGGGNRSRQTCMVFIEKDGRGEVSGEGVYSAFENVTCTAAPHMAGDIQTSEFIQWTGDIASYSQTLTFSVGDYLLRGQVRLTAVFHDLNPCADEENDRRDPLREMRIQASGGGGWNIKGGTFGWTRDGKTTFHGGMDFACPVGTPVFATHPGKVSAIRDDVLPDDGSFQDYRDRGGRDCKELRSFNAGNAVEVECIVNNRLYTIKYYHLSSIADGLVENGSVEAGDIIGYSGVTGNGGSKSSGGPHLHYQVNVGRDIHDRTNPEPFIYSKFDDKGIQTNPCDE